MKGCVRRGLVKGRDIQCAKPGQKAEDLGSLAYYTVIGSGVQSPHRTTWCWDEGVADGNNMLLHTFVGYRDKWERYNEAGLILVRDQEGR